jgi:hypothetical protein
LDGRQRVNKKIRAFSAPNEEPGKAFVHSVKLRKSLLSLSSADERQGRIKDRTDPGID